MRLFFEELIFVYNHSSRTRWAIYLGFIFFIGVTLIGNHVTSNFHLSGPLKFMEDVFREKILHKYEKIAFYTLFSFFGLAIKFFIKDKKRLLG